MDFWKDVNAILETSCVRCHGPRRAYGNFRIDRREDFFGQDGRAALVVPGKSAESPLIAIVRGQRPDMRMAAAHKLADRQADVLRAWIDAGAQWPNKAGDR
jgi:mono/diheme cytochrome c family protein